MAGFDGNSRIFYINRFDHVFFDFLRDNEGASDASVEEDISLEQSGLGFSGSMDYLQIISHLMGTSFIIPESEERYSSIFSATDEYDDTTGERYINIQAVMLFRKNNDDQIVHIDQIYFTRSNLGIRSWFQILRAFIRQMVLSHLCSNLFIQDIPRLNITTVGRMNVRLDEMGFIELDLDRNMVSMIYEIQNDRINQEYIEEHMEEDIEEEEAEKKNLIDQEKNMNRDNIDNVEKGINENWNECWICLNKIRPDDSCMQCINPDKNHKLHRLCFLTLKKRECGVCKRTKFEQCTNNIYGGWKKELILNEKYKRKTNKKNKQKKTNKKNKKTKKQKKINK